MTNKRYCGLVVVMSAAMIVLLISVVVYIGTHMGPPHWEPRVCRWFEENHIDKDDLKLRIIKDMQLSDDEVLFCATSSCVAAKCLILQNENVNMDMKLELIRRAYDSDYDELKTAARSKELKIAIVRLQYGDWYCEIWKILDKIFPAWS